MRAALSAMSGKNDVKDIQNTSEFSNLMEDITSTKTTNNVLQEVHASSKLAITGVLANVNLKDVRVDAEVRALQE